MLSELLNKIYLLNSFKEGFKVFSIKNESSKSRRN